MKFTKSLIKKIIEKSSAASKRAKIKEKEAEQKDKKPAYLRDKDVRKMAREANEASRKLRARKNKKRKEGILGNLFGGN